MSTIGRALHVRQKGYHSATFLVRWINVLARCFAVLVTIFASFYCYFLCIFELMFQVYEVILSRCLGCSFFIDGLSVLRKCLGVWFSATRGRRGKEFYLLVVLVLLCENEIGFFSCECLGF